MNRVELSQSLVVAMYAGLLHLGGTWKTEARLNTNFIRLKSISPMSTFFWGSKRDIESALESYDLMSQRLFTHASPTLFNAGTQRPQLSSCFLLNMKEDSIEGIYDTLKQVC